jgi:RimJ/RimL family protein N-acetyltransferase
MARYEFRPLSPRDLPLIDRWLRAPHVARIGRGHGTTLTRQFVEQLFAAGAPQVVTDPDPTNARAVRVCEKAGFCGKRVVDTPWGRTLLMVCTS